MRISILRNTGFGWSKIDYLCEKNTTRIILPKKICGSLYHRNIQGNTLCGFQNAEEIFVAKFCLNSYVLVSVYIEQYMFYWCIVNLSCSQQDCCLIVKCVCLCVCMCIK